MKAIFVLLLLPLQLFSQDLSGIWVGTIATSQAQMPFELAINRDMTGYSMVTFMYKGAEKVAVKKITLIQKDSIFTISDDKLIYNNFETRSRSIKTFCDFSIKMFDSTMVLSGAFHTRTRDLRAGDSDLATGTITLQKQNIQAHTRLIKKLDTLKLSNTLAFSNPRADIKETPAVAVSKQEVPAVAVSEKEAPAVAVSEKEAPAVAVSKKEAPKVAVSGKEAPAVAETPVKDLIAVRVQQRVSSEKGRNGSYSVAGNNTTTAPAIPTNLKINAPAADVATRKTEVIRTIDFKSDSLVLTLYDNGIVDGDTVSVVLNDLVIIPRQGLTEQAYRKIINIPPDWGDSLQLVLYAENLGSIPPNSGLLIIEDGADRYEVGFKGDLKNSSAVQLRRKRSL
ncbi:hypothetical protein ACQ86N_46620 [Puia sp. P3]|uniref:hypothetical protein n=1 Tax=Puia sp. P3 TaxID=3423952 RepID=UPI003D67A786